jgi:hypothetical protein
MEACPPGRKSGSKLSHSIRFAQLADKAQLPAALSTMRAAFGVLRLAVAFSAQGMPLTKKRLNPKSGSELPHAIRFAQLADKAQLPAALSSIRAAFGVLRLAVAFSAERTPPLKTRFHPKSGSKLSHSIRFAQFRPRLPAP